MIDLSKSFHFATLADVKLLVHSSFGFLSGGIALLSISMGKPLFFLGFLCVFGFVILHEYGHIFAARYHGYTAERITLTGLGGMAEISSCGESPREIIHISLAGPLVNIALLLVAAVLAWIIGWNPYIEFVFKINLILAVFNMVPAYPLDGGRFLQGLIWNWFGYVRSYEWTCKIGQAAAIGIFLWSIWNIALLGIFIAFFVFKEARNTLRAFRMAIADMDPETVDGLRRFRGPDRPLL